MCYGVQVGRASRQKKPPSTVVFMAPCEVCGVDWPWPPAFAKPQPAEKARICQRCLLLDLARVIRECPERFHQLPTIRALRDLPPVDLLIRTGGEVRVSNFMLWQISYAELYFSPVYWPSFGREQLLEAFAEFARRERRFGGG